QFVKNKQVTAKSLWEFIHQNFNFPENLAQETDEFIHLFEKAKKEKDQVKEYLNNENLSIEHDELTKLKHLLKEEKLDVVRLIELLSTTNFTSKKALTESEKLWKKLFKDKTLFIKNLDASSAYLNKNKQKQLLKLLNSTTVSPYKIWYFIYNQLVFKTDSSKDSANALVLFENLLASASKKSTHLTQELLLLDHAEKELLKNHLIAQTDAFAHIWEVKHPEVSIG
ncbi:hypothetical protein, partial [Psychroflexus salis]|uniref:hypothetical protein n=1 Tax=Psychroflexus salis TaxID=1526574 RepID=UPI001663390E